MELESTESIWGLFVGVSAQSLSMIQTQGGRLVLIGLNLKHLPLTVREEECALFTVRSCNVTREHR